MKGAWQKFIWMIGKGAKVTKEIGFYLKTSEIDLVKKEHCDLNTRFIQ